MGILEHHAQGPAQIVLFDVPHIDAVIGHGPLLHVVETVDEVGDGGLAGAGGAHKSDLLAGLCKEADVLEDGVGALVAEGHVVKADIPPERNFRAVGLAPGPAALLLLHQPDLSLVHLRCLVHGLKDPLGAGQGGQEEVALLGELVDGQGRLAHEHQIAGKAAHIGEALHGHIATQGGHDGVVDIGDAHHRRDHGGGIGLGAGARLAQGLVLLPEAAQVLLLVVEHLHHLLSGHHLLNIAVQVAQVGLLLLIVGLAPLSAVPDIEEHGHIAHGHHQRQLPVEDKEHGEGAHHLDKALDHHGKAVVEGIGDGVHIVGEIAHDIAVAVGVKEAQGQGLQVGEQVPADVEEHLLGRLDHGLGIAQGGQGTHKVDGRRHRHALQKGPDAAVGQGIHHRADHVGAQQVGQGADGDQHRHQGQQVLVPPQVGQQRTQGISQVFRLFTADRTGCHGPRLLSFAMRRSPDRWGPRPAAGHGCRWRGPCRPPE